MEKMRLDFRCIYRLQKHQPSELHATIHDFAALSRFITDVERATTFWILYRWIPNLALLRRLLNQPGRDGDALRCPGP